MKRKKKIFSILIILCIIGIIGGAWAWKAYHKTRPTLDAVAADVTISASKLYSDFSSDENNANKLYLNKVIEVSGKVLSTQKDKGQVSVELQSSDGAMGGINCAMRDTVDLPKQGDSISVKGRCTGYLMDVSLVDAINVVNK